MRELCGCVAKAVRSFAAFLPDGDSTGLSGSFSRLCRVANLKLPARLVGRPVGRPCGVAGPGVACLGPAREKILAKPNEHESNSPRKARRPARWERLRFLAPERRRTGPTGADREREPARNVPQPPPFRRRASLSDGSSRSGRIPRGPPRTQTSIMIDLCAGTCVSNDSESKSRLDGHASHCCTARLIALAIGTAASSA